MAVSIRLRQGPWFERLVLLAVAVLWTAAAAYVPFRYVILAVMVSGCFVAVIFARYLIYHFVNVWDGRRARKRAQEDQTLDLKIEHNTPI